MRLKKHDQIDNGQKENDKVFQTEARARRAGGKTTE